MNIKMRATFLVITLSVFFTACNTAQKSSQIASTEKEGVENRVFVSLDGDTLIRVEKPEEEWKQQLSELEYKVLRKAGTERAFTGEYWNNKKAGTYICRACELPLFESKTKYRSGTGWPSFFQPLRADHVQEESDYTLGMVRTEVLCARCGGHLGHVFDDGPRPTGLRYCLNSASLTFVEEGKKEEK